MAVLEKLRGWGIFLSILVALPLLLFIIDPSQIIQTVQSVSSKYDVGKIGGKAIHYNDFKDEVDRYSRIMMGQSSSSEQQQIASQNAVWRNLLNQNLFIKNAQAAGINVGEDEFKTLLDGENVSPIIASMFYDENGMYSHDNLVAFLENAEVNPDFKAVWDYLKNDVLVNQYYAKYNSLFAQSNIENAVQVKRSIDDNNTTANVEFVMVPLTYAVDTNVVVTDKEIKDYYANHKKFFRQRASRDIEYAVFQVVPSESDIAEAKAKFETLSEELATTDNVRAFLQQNSDSDSQWKNVWYKAGDLTGVNAELDGFVATNNEGVSPVYFSGNTFYAGRVMASAMLPEKVSLRHMLFQSNADGQHLADSLLNVLKQGGNFSELANEYSLDRNSAYNGEFGSVGEIYQSNVPNLPSGFDAIFTAKKGQPFIIQSSGSTHIVEVTDASEPVLHKQVAVLKKEVIPSHETSNRFYSAANRLASLSAGSYEKFRAACDSVGTYAHSMTVYEETDTYGTIGHAKEITRWAFDNKPGKVSNMITVDNNYFFVVAVKEAHKEGIATVSEVADQIRNVLYVDKYAAKRQSEIKEQIAGLTDLEAIAEKLGTAVSTRNDITFASQAQNARTLDPKFIGAVAAAKEGELYGPIAGNTGVYVFKVLGRDTGSYYTESDAKNANARYLSAAVQNLLSVMADDADVKDNRARFF